MGWISGLSMLAMIFLPGALLAGAMPFWDGLRRRPGVRNMLAGVNAAVVGVLLSALYDPVWTSAIRGPADFGLALLLFGLLVYARWSPVWVVMTAAAGGRWAGWPDPPGAVQARRASARALLQEGVDALGGVLFHHVAGLTSPA